MLKAILAFVLTRRTIVLLGLMVLLGGGIAAFTMLNIEAYPQPAPVIIEITAQQGGLSAEEMERYYTVPMEVGIYGTPYITAVNSTSFYGLSFLPVTFKYGVENIFRNFQLSREKQRDLLEDLAEGQLGGDPSVKQDIHTMSTWTDRLRLIYISAMQVDRAVLFSVAITVAAFVPLFTMQGVEGQIFGPMARTYGYALVGAVIATFTITPVLSSILLPQHVKEVETAVVRALRSAYTPALRWALDRRRVTVGIGTVFLLVTGLLATRLGSEFLPALEEGNYWIRLSMPPTMGLAAGTEGVRKIREILLSHPEIITAISQHGRPDNGSDPSPFSNVELFVPLKPHSEWPRGLSKDQLTATLLREFKDAVPGLTFNFSQNIQDNIEEATSGVKGANSVKIIGHNLEELEKLAREVSDQIKQVRGMEDVGTFHVVGQPNLNISIDREKAARYGLNTGDVNTVIQAAMGGAIATTLLEGDRSWNVTVRLAPKYRDNIEAVGDVRVGYQNAAGTPSYIPLRELATITLDTGASYIYHEAMQRFIPVKFSVRGRDLGSTVEEAQERIAKNVTLPTGYRLVVPALQIMFLRPSDAGPSGAVAAKGRK